jgi:hypothetical protein
LCALCNHQEQQLSSDRLSSFLYFIYFYLFIFFYSILSSFLAPYCTTGGSKEKKNGGWESSERKEREK